MMLFRTALALMELYGTGVPPFLVNAKLPSISEVTFWIEASDHY